MGLRGNEIEKREDGGLGVEDGLMDVDMDNVGRVLEVVGGEMEWVGVFVLFDEGVEVRGRGEVGGLREVEKEGMLGNVEGVEGGERGG